jgi:hypothetical protein
VFRREPKQFADAHPRRTAVRYDHQRPAIGNVDNVTLDCGDNPVGHLNPRLAVATRATVGAETPSSQFRAVQCRQFVARQPLPCAGVRLAQVDVGNDRQPYDVGQRGRRLHRSRQVAADDRVGFQVREQLGRAPGLAQTDRIERYVELALEPALGVPFGAPMSPEDDPSSAQLCSPASADCRTRSRFSGIVGQSFQSRSIA